MLFVITIKLSYACDDQLLELAELAFEKCIVLYMCMSITRITRICEL